MTVMRSFRLSIIAALVAVLASLGLVASQPMPAQAAPKVSVSGTAQADGASELKLSGSGFQSIQGGFGGIYVLFGWVDDPSGGWRPSAGGITGEDYQYQYDDETNPEGYQLFVTFPGSSTATAANGGEVAADGSWSGTLKLQGAQFDTFDRQQNRTTLDCTEVQCGIITIGAHGVKNANNESFTPIDFEGGGGGATDADDAAPEGEETEAPEREAAAVPVVDDTVPQAAPAAPIIDPAAMQETNRMLLILVILLGIAAVLAISVIGLSFGIGGFLAAKSLLLGVSPEALERERMRRERRAIRAREKRKRKIDQVRRREELKTAKATNQGQGRLAREEIRQLPPANESYDQIVKFFENDPSEPPREPAYSGTVPSVSAAGPQISAASEAPTMVQPLTRPRREDRDTGPLDSTELGSPDRTREASEADDREDDR